MNKIFRFEFKYIMTDRKAKFVMEALKRYGMKPDPEVVNPDNSYPVTSLYFDSWGYNDYLDKAGGFMLRKKIRLRTYADDFEKGRDNVWLETKRKHDMTINKNRLRFSPEEFEMFKESFGKISKRFRVGENHDIFEDIVRDIFLQGSFPRVLIRYKRHPLIVSGNSYVRITFDSQIEACKTNGFMYNGKMIPVAKGLTVMELKYDNYIPKWFRNIIREFELQRSAFSKYSLSVDVINQYKPLHR
jgi:hypothetical protein